MSKEHSESTDVLEMDDAINGYTRADLLSRILARAIDLLFFGFFACLGSVVGVMAGLLYLAIADGLMNGRSLGKKIIRIQVLSEPELVPVGFKGSIIRNATIFVIVLFAIVPIIGWILFFTLGLVIIAVEIYLMVVDTGHRRAGDIMARTVVVLDPVETNRE